MSAGREGLLPAAFGRHMDSTKARTSDRSPDHRALIVTGVFAGLGLDPVLNMFTWVSQLGTLGVLAMMAITSAAVIAFFRRPGKRLGPSTLILPLVPGVIMVALFVYIFMNFGDLTGTTGGSLGWILPSLIPLAWHRRLSDGLAPEAADPLAMRRWARARRPDPGAARPFRPVRACPGPAFVLRRTDGGGKVRRQGRHCA